MGRRSAGGGGTSVGAGAGGKVALVRAASERQGAGNWGWRDLARGFEQEMEGDVVGFGVVRRTRGVEGR